MRYGSHDYSIIYVALTLLPKPNQAFYLFAASLLQIVQSLRARLDEALGHGRVANELHLLLLGLLEKFARRAEGPGHNLGGDAVILQVDKAAVLESVTQLLADFLKKNPWSKITLKRIVRDFLPRISSSLGFEAPSPTFEMPRRGIFILGSFSL